MSVHFPDLVIGGRAVGCVFFAYWMVTNVSRMAYIDSKMAEMREGERAAAAAAAAAAAGINGTSQDIQGQKIAFSSSSAIPLDTHRERQPAGMGKLMEIDLGPEAAQRNIQRTEEATRRLQNGGSLDQVEEQLKGRRGRKRRTSEDIRRDKLVEEILKESRRKFRVAYFRSKLTSAANYLFQCSRNLRRSGPAERDRRRRGRGRPHRRAVQARVHGGGADAEQ